MNVKENRVRDLITEEAAEWFVANRAGLSSDRRDSFVAWLQTSPVHVEEYLALASMAGDLRKACEVAQSSFDELFSRARLEDEGTVQPFWRCLVDGLTDFGPFRWRTVAVAMAACGVLGIGLFAWRDFNPASRGAVPLDATVLHFETRHFEQQTHRLADNTIVHLNMDTSVTVRYGQKDRLVVLNAGEAHFEVAHESDRAFRVAAGSALIVDIGTKFDVRLQSDSTVVTVVEGLVGVGRSSPLGHGRNSSPVQSQQSVEVAAGQQIRVSEDQWPPKPVTVDSQHAIGWLHRKIMFDREPLERVTTEFNRYASKPIEIATPLLRKLEISGVFATDDTAEFIAFLRSLEGVRVEETPTQIRVSRD